MIERSEEQESKPGVGLPDLSSIVKVLEGQLDLMARLATIERSPGPGTPPAARPRTGVVDLVLLGAALGLLGGALGLVAGMSDAEGISRTLVSAVLGFVGGSLLSHLGQGRSPSGWLSRSGADEDGRRMAVGLGAFALGLMSLVLVGTWLRTVGVPSTLVTGDAGAVSGAQAADAAGNGARVGDSAASDTQDRAPTRLVLRSGDGKRDDGVSAIAAEVDLRVQNGDYDDALRQCSGYWADHAALAASCGRTYRALGDGAAGLNLLRHAQRLQPPGMDLVKPQELAEVNERGGP